MTVEHLEGAAAVLFSGGRGGSSIARGLVRTPGTTLSVVINGYDNGSSTGMLRRYLPGMLGPSDFRKNLLLHLDAGTPAQAAMIALLEHRLPPGATYHDLAAIIRALAAPESAEGSPSDGIGGHQDRRMFAALPARTRAEAVRDLSFMTGRLGRDPEELALAGCALGNLLFAGAYLRLGEDFNAAVRACAATFRSPARLLNVTNGENAYLTALKQDGRILTDEADIVAPQCDTAITDLYLLREPVSPERRAELQALPAELVRPVLAGAAAEVTLNPEADRAIRDADLIVYGPGTPHSSLLPTYLTPGVADAVSDSRAAAKVFVVNIHDDHDVQGLGPRALVRRTLSYLGDPYNERRTVTHVLCHRATFVGAVDGGGWEGARWVVTDLEDPERPGVHCGRRTLAALAGIVGTTAGETALVRTV
ncbi:2-phospho-L-lactate transferase CofD family protein [Nonomuraea sp. NPDC003560]|uniref:2-phospho-L-lactate transferase CofD family protein n=1 Tax=Nonomuraea sp. NPDC003560 TaxID=3364341 RepID=UPI0036CB9C30